MLYIYEEGKTIKDSAFIDNGIFKFTVSVSSHYFASLTMPDRNNDYLSFYMEPSIIDITGRSDSLKF
ncbi:MAG: DUF4369 domain-containing protein [Ginsengibacter sp.]